MIRFWRVHWLNPRTGYDIIAPMSPSTLRIEHHDPGGLTPGKTLVELAINLLLAIGLIEFAAWLDPVFGVVFVVVLGFALAFVSDKVRFKLFERKPATVRTTYEHTEIPAELVARYEKAMADLAQIDDELEKVASANGLNGEH